MSGRYAILLLALCLSACQDGNDVYDLRPPNYQPPSDAERFASSHGAQIHGESVKSFLQSRTAIVISGAPLAAFCDEGPGIHLFFRDLKANQGHHSFQLDVGEAAAIDPRGYFLTAAHTLTSSNVYLLYYVDQKPRVMVPRIVGRDGDLALLHISDQLTNTFIFSTAIPKANVCVFGIGLTEPHSVKQAMAVSWTVLGGRLIADTRSELFTREMHVELPVRRGDSGGALVSSNGDFLGTVCKAFVASDGSHTNAIALSPNKEWLEGLILKDQSAPQADPLIGELLKSDPLDHSPLDHSPELIIAR